MSTLRVRMGTKGQEAKSLPKMQVSPGCAEEGQQETRGEERMIEDLSIDKIKEMIWEEITLPIYGGEGVKPGVYSSAEALRAFIIKHRLCRADVLKAFEALRIEGRKLPNGLLSVWSPEIHTEAVEMGDEYEAMTVSGALQCVKKRD
jgi:hypothetical protein